MKIVTLIIGVIFLICLNIYPQNIYKVYTNTVYKQTKILNKLLDYSEKMSKKEQEKFHSEYYAIFRYLTTTQILNERYAFQINMLYYGEDNLSKRMTKQGIKKEVGVFIEKKEIPKVADYFIKLLNIVINGTIIKKSTPVEVKNIIESFKDEHDILKMMLIINNSK
ncbi:MAG: hypothetical protein ACYC49_09870 [Ignavibacteriaceae bacterium]